MDSASSEERAPLLEKRLEVDPSQLTSLASSFKLDNGSVSGPITVAVSNEQPVTSTLTMAIAAPDDYRQALKASGTEEDLDEYMYGPKSPKGGRSKSKHRRNKRQTKKKRPIRRRQTKRKQRRYTKRRIVRKRR